MQYILDMLGRGVGAKSHKKSYVYVGKKFGPGVQNTPTRVIKG